MREEKLQVGIYKINLENSLFSGNIDSIRVLSDNIQSKYSTYQTQELSETTLSGFSFRLLYSVHPTNPKWKNFLGGITASDQSINEKDKSKAESFVLLVKDSSSNNLYAITGGLTGFFAIQEHIEDDFGVEILSRLIKKKDKILKSVKEKSVIGGILGSTKFFRSNYNLFENDSFGKIYQELQASLNKDLLTQHFGFSVNELKKGAVCVAKASFRINRSVTVEQLLKIISGCEFVLENLEPITINSVTRIIKKRNPELVAELERELFNQLWQRFNEDGFIDFDLCHKDFENYLTADEYIVRKGTSKNNFFDEAFESLENIDELFEKLKSSSDGPDSEEELRNLLSSLKIYAYGEDEENELTRSSLISHLFGDVSHEKKKYFLIDNNWFEIAGDFINELDQNCKRFIDDHSDDGIIEKQWTSLITSEDIYNETYVGENKTLVLHKITPENIELCDLLKWDDESVYLCHVKEGFGNTTRSLCSQILISSTRLLNDINDKTYLSSVYDQLESKKISNNQYFQNIGEQTNSITKEQFLDLFKNRKTVFVLAITDTTGHNRSLARNIEDFKSSIAKFSLQELAKDMRGLDLEFRICQIDREI